MIRGQVAQALRQRGQQAVTKRVPGPCPQTPPTAPSRNPVGQHSLGGAGALTKRCLLEGRAGRGRRRRRRAGGAPLASRSGCVSSERSRCWWLCRGDGRRNTESGPEPGGRRSCGLLAWAPRPCPGHSASSLEGPRAMKSAGTPTRTRGKFGETEQQGRLLGRARASPGTTGRLGSGRAPGRSQGSLSRPPGRAGCALGSRVPPMRAGVSARASGSGG